MEQQTLGASGNPVRIGFSQQLFGYNQCKWLSKIAPVEFEAVKKQLNSPATMNYSIDSRYIGFIPQDKIIGKVNRILYSVKDGKVDWGRTLRRIR